MVKNQFSRLLISLLLFVVTMTSHGNIQNVLSSQEGYVDVPGGKVWYQKWFTEQSKDKPPLLVLHGGPAVAHNYLQPLSQLARHRPVIFYDQLGCGKSATAKSDSTLWVLPRFIAELEALAEALNLKQFHLLGHSWGGALATGYALKHQDKLKSLTLASPLLSTPLWIEGSRELLKKLPQETQQTILKHEQAGTTDSKEYQDATQVFYHQFLCCLKEWPQVLIDSFNLLNPEIYKTMWGPSEFTALGNLSQLDYTNDLKQIRIPTLITCGRFDSARPETMQKTLTQFQKGQLAVFEKSSHVPHLEETEDYLKQLANFIEKWD